MTMTTASSLIVLTLWMKWYGYQMVMGNSQASAKDFVFKAVRAWIIIAFATGLAASMGFSIRTVTTDLSNLVSEAMTGSDSGSACVTNTGNNNFTGCKIDKNLVRMQAAMAFVNQLDTGADPVLEDKKARASLMTAAGIGGPAIVAGGLLLTLKVAMALFIALGPIFIMCLLFKQTTPLFQKWLYYGLSTMFATAMFAVVSDIAMDLVENTTAALFVSDLFTTTLDPTGASNAAAAGIMNASVQQLGLGLMLSTLLITTPAMAANFFNGVMGSFSHQSAFQNWGGARTPAQNGTNGQNGQNGNNGVSPAPTINSSPQGSNTTMPTPSQVYIPNNNASVNKDVIKTDSSVGNASKGFAHNEVIQADRAIKDPPASTTPSSGNKAGLMLLIGTTALMNSGVEKAYAQGYWEQAQQQQRQQEEQNQRQIQEDAMRRNPQYACVNGRDIYGHIGDAACGGGQPTNTRPVPPKPSSYGAVAWGSWSYGSSTNQTNKQNAINAALQSCSNGGDSCKIQVIYSNQCVAQTYGIQKNGAYWWRISYGSTQKQATQAALKDCGKIAKNCQVSFSECSLP